MHEGCIATKVIMTRDFTSTKTAIIGTGVTRDIKYIIVIKT